MGRLPLEGIRVADFSWIINGPQIAQWLATMGAEVIKIESQVYIDIGRTNPAGMADRIPGVESQRLLSRAQLRQEGDQSQPRASEGARARPRDHPQERLRPRMLSRLRPREKLGLTYDEMRRSSPTSS